MMKKRAQSTAIAAGSLLGLIGAGLSVALLAGTPVGTGVAPSATAAGWIIPLAAAAIIAGVAWTLLGARSLDSTDGTPFDSALCPECGRQVLGQWRICPYCAAALHD
jgi:hypothetical protein